MKKNGILMLGILPVIGLGVNGVSYAIDNRVDDHVPKTEYEKLKREVETLKSQMQRLLEAAPATPESKPAAAETKGEKKPSTRASPSSQERVGRSAGEEFEVEKGDRRKEAEEAKRELDQFLRAQKLLFKPGEVQFEFSGFYAHDLAENTCFGFAVRFCAPGSPVTPKLITRLTGTEVLIRYGLAEDVEFDLSVPGVFIEQERDFTPFTTATGAPVSRTDNVGLGDVSWALRYAAWHEHGNLPEITLNVDVKSDTGDEDRGLGTGHWNVGTGASLVKTIDPVVLFGSLGYTWTLEEGVDVPGTLEQRDVDPGDQIPYSIGMGFSLNDRVSFSMAMAGAAIRRTEINGNEIVGSGLDIDSLQFTATVQLAKRVYVEPFVGFGLTDEAGDFLVGINVPVGLEGRFPLPFFSH